MCVSLVTLEMQIETTISYHEVRKHLKNTLVTKLGRAGNNVIYMSYWSIN